jgi:hypothetical protein
MEAEIRSTLNEKGRSGSYAYSRNPGEHAWLVVALPQWEGCDPE